MTPRPEAAAVPSSLTDAWAALVGTALLGTDRRPLPPAPGGLVAGFGEGDDPAVALLERAAAISLARRAGARPGPVPAPLPVGPADARPPCPPAAAERLRHLLDGPGSGLLPEWLDRLAAGGWRLPPEHAVALLQAAAARPGLESSALAATGPLAGWLAALFPELGLAALPPDTADREAIWRTGRPADRLRMLEAERASAPAAGRARLAAGWRAEPAATRATLLAALAEGLGPDDEGFLETALDDRSAAVRQRAASLLAEVPGSALARRMAERLVHTVRLVHRPSRVGLAVDGPPVPPPADWVRDGLDSPPPAGTARSRWILRDLVAAAPLSAWAGIGSAEDVVGALARHGAASLLVPALAGAVRRSGDPTWAAVVFAASGDISVVACLDPAGRVAWARAGASSDRILEPATRACLAALPVPWPDDVRATVAATVTTLFARGRLAWNHGPALRDLVIHLDPALLAPLAAAVEAAPAHAHQAPLQGAVVDLARTRHTMLEELS